MRVPILVAAVVAGTVALGVSRAAAQSQPDLWEVSASAAANAGLDSPVAPIILGNALAVARKRDPEGVRTRLTLFQLMLAYVAVDQFELFKKVYGVPTLKFDVSEFDQDLKDYIPTLRRLQDAYFNRWKDPRPEDKGVRLEALGYASKNFAELEVALRKKIASEDAMGLADALANRGLVFKRLHDQVRAIDDYQKAFELFDVVRRERNAIERAERAFSMEDSRAGSLDVGALTEGAEETLIVSADEPFLPVSIIIATLPNAVDAIDKGSQSDAQKYVKIMQAAQVQGDRLTLFMNATWPCHAYLADTQGWHALLDQTRMKYAVKFEQGSGNAERHFRQAEAEYRKSLQIDLFSNGASDHFKEWAGAYVEFLKDAGHEEEAKRAAEIIESIGRADIGSGGPGAWRELLDCTRKSM